MHQEQRREYRLTLVEGMRCVVLGVYGTLTPPCRASGIDAAAVSCQHAPRQMTRQEVRQVNLDENKAVVRRWIDGWNTRGADAVDDLFSPEFQDRQLAPDGGPVTLDSFKERLRTLDSMLGPGEFEEQEMIAEGDRVMVRWVLRGTHSGPFLGLPPTGRTFSVDGVNIFRIADGRIVERWSFFDVTALLAQLGAKVAPA